MTENKNKKRVILKDGRVGKTFYLPPEVIKKLEENSIKNKRTMQKEVEFILEKNLK